MKLIISSIVVGIVLFLLGWLIYGFLLMDFYKQYFGHISRVQSDMKLWAIAVANFAQAFFMYLVYSKGYRGGSPIFEGIKFGILIGLFVGIPYVFYTWAGMPVKYTGVIIDGIVMIFMYIVAGVITGLIFGKKDVKTV